MTAAFVGLRVFTAEGATVGLATGLVEGKGVVFTLATRAPVTR